MTARERVISFFNRLKNEGITQKKFSETTGFPETSISSVRRGTTKIPRVDLIAAILKFDNRINPYWLILGEGEMFLNGIEKKEEEVSILAEKMGQTIDLDMKLAPDTDPAIVLQHMMPLIKDIQERLEKAGL